MKNFLVALVVLATVAPARAALPAGPHPYEAYVACYQAASRVSGPGRKGFEICDSGHLVVYAEGGLYLFNRDGDRFSAPPRHLSNRLVLPDGKSYYFTLPRDMDNGFPHATVCQDESVMKGVEVGEFRSEEIVRPESPAVWNEILLDAIHGTGQNFESFRRMSRESGVPPRPTGEYTRALCRCLEVPDAGIREAAQAQLKWFKEKDPKAEECEFHGM